MQRKIRVLVGKPGLDGHDRGAKVVAAALRDAGMEVIYTGLHQTPAQVVEAAIQEDVDVVALSILSGAHMTLFPEVLAMMETLAKMGVGRLFGPGASTQEIAKYIRDWFDQQHAATVVAAPAPGRAAAQRASSATGSQRQARRSKRAAAKAREASSAKRAAARGRRGAAKRGRPEPAGSGASRKRR